MTRPWTLPALGFVLGEIGFMAVGWMSLMMVVILTIVCFALVQILKRHADTVINTKNINSRIALIIIGITVGCLRLGIASIPDSERIKLNNMSDSMEADRYEHIVDAIDEKSDRLVIRCGQLLVYSDNINSNEMHIGNTVIVYGKINKATRASNPGQFDYASYYKAQGIYFTCFADEVKTIDRTVNYPLEAIRAIKMYSQDTISTVCQKQDRAFIEAALLGDKSNIDEDDYNLYRANGIAHLLAISGLHIGILGLGLYKLLRKKIRLGFILSGVISSIVLVIYMIMTGSSVSVCRSVTMLLLFFAAECLGRTGDLCNTAAIVAIVLLLINPYELCQCGFQLSFMAVIAIGGPAQSIIKKYNISNPLLSSAIISITVQLVTLPIIAYSFFEVPLYATLLNMIVIPLMALVVWSGLLIIVLGGICVWAAYIPAGVAHYIISLYRLLCTYISKLPMSSICVGRPQIWQIVLYSIVMAIAWICILDKRKQIRVISIFMIFGALLTLRHIQSGCTVTTYIDVGQGDGIYIQDADINILVDSGSTSNKKIGEQVLKPFLLSKAVTELDYVFATHADLDHINGIEYLLTDCEDIHIDKLILPIAAIDDDKYDGMIDAAVHNNTQIYYMARGDKINTANGTIVCMSPERGINWKDCTDTNRESLVLLYKRGGFSELLMGDADKQAEDEIINSFNSFITDTTVLKVGHHGSSSSSSEEFIDVANPKIAILSYGLNNRYGHPHDETMQILNQSRCLIYDTATCGAITIKTDGKGVDIDTFY